MKNREIFFYSLIFFIFSALAVNVVLFSLTNKSIANLYSANILTVKDSTELIDAGTCSENPKIQLLNQSPNLQIKELDKYQDICNSFVSDRMMIFTDMPKDKIVAKKNAVEMSNTLKEFSKYNIKPIVIIEPISDWGLIDFEEFKTGFYNDWIEEYFKQIKAEGITDNMMGVWVPFPEANLPNWNHNNASPEDFSAIVNIYLRILEKYFPETKTSILLNSATYENDDFNWMNGEYVSLRSYVEGIDKGLVDSFGIQGFPWVPSADDEGEGITDAREFLNAPLAIEAADILGVKEIWFNTGTFSAKYTLDSAITVQVSAQKRKNILDGIFEEVYKTKSKGYNVWINLFAEDKSMSSEATNWSYWKGNAAKPEHQAILIDFLSKLNRSEIQISLFDTDNQL